MICDNVLIKGSVEIGDRTIIQPLCSIISERGYSIVIGEGNIIEERVKLINTSISMVNLIEVNSNIINSQIGSFCKIGSKCEIINCQIGNCCVISSMIKLENVTLPDNTSVYPTPSGWKMIPVQVDTTVSYFIILLIILILLILFISIKCLKIIELLFQPQKVDILLENIINYVNYNILVLVKYNLLFLFSSVHNYNYILIINIFFIFTFTT